MGRLQGKITLVTGAASGIGKSIAEIFASEGAVVVATDVNEKGGQQAVEEIRQRGGSGLFLQQDVTQEAQWAEVMEAVAKQYGKLDVLVNNAGVTERGNAETISLADWKAVIDINLHGVFLGIQHGIRSMKETGGGSIINMSSIEGQIGDANCAAYTASKAGVRVFTKSAALLCAREGYKVRINSIHPGVIRTALVDAWIKSKEDPEAEYQRLVAKTPIGCLGDPADVAYGAVYLASDEAKFVTGSELVIDGGYTAQ